MIRILAAFPILAGLTATAGEVDYLRDIKPVLAARCYACHGAMEQKASLRVDTAASLRAGGDSGPLIEPGSAAESYLIDVLTGDAGFRMPPEGEPLDDAQIDLIRAWIAAGAPAPADEAPQPSPEDHWAFRPPVRPAVPAVVDPAWGANPIDAFLAAEHERRGLVPVPEADRATLLRRVALDLTGLVPTREELQAFLVDDRPDAYERAVDRLLASPAYGERWGRHWMDVWRYSDWDGYGKEVRESRPHIWRWRDWIVESLNADVGYDRMVRAMLAGDEIAPDDPSTLRATGFLARNWYKFNRNIWLDNTVEHTSKAFLGLTVDCARCHDHKYDPIPQADYYRFRAFFEPIEVAADRVPGQPDTDVDGLARVYDAHADRPTYLYRRGDEKQPVEDHPLDPAVPRALGAVPEIAPVDLPAVASYPGLRDHVRREALDAAEAAVDAARAELESARAEARPDVADPARRTRRPGRRRRAGGRRGPPGRRRGPLRRGPRRPPRRTADAPRRPRRTPGRRLRGRTRPGQRRAVAGRGPRRRQKRGPEDEAGRRGRREGARRRHQGGRGGGEGARRPAPDRLYPADAGSAGDEHRASARPGPVDHRPVEPADGPGRGQSRLDASLRGPARRVGLRLRPQRRGAEPSRAARLAGRRADGVRLEPEAPSPIDRDLAGLPDAVLGRRPTTRMRRSTPRTAPSGG